MIKVMLLRALSGIRRLERAAGSADHALAMINLKLTTRPITYQLKKMHDAISILMLKTPSRSLPTIRLLAILKPSLASGKKSK